jgi:hypothetical protein
MSAQDAERFAPYSVEYVDALVELEAREAAVSRLLAVYLRRLAGPIAERLRHGLEAHLHQLLAALVHIHSHTPESERATDAWRAETGRRDGFVLAVRSALEVADLLLKEADGESVGTQLGRLFAQVVDQADELSNLILAFDEDEDAAVARDEERTSQIQRRHARLEWLVDNVKPSVLDQLAACPEFAGCITDVQTTLDAARDVFDAGWREAPEMDS